MQKKLIFCLFCSAAIFSLSCSDDGGKYKEGARCNANSFGYNGSLCENDDTLVRCANNVIAKYDCDAGCKVEKNSAVCALPDKTACGSVTEKGACRNGDLVKCVDGALATEKCGSGTECQTADGVSQCVPTEELCGDITSNGQCEDNGKTLVYCKSGLIVRETCNPKCLTPDGVFYQCFEKCSAELEALGEAGKCEDNGFTYCSNQYGTISKSCGRDEKCAQDDDGNYRCVSTAAGCGDITSNGVCANDKTLKYCDNGMLKTETCSVRCVSFPDTNNGTFAQCYEPCGNVTADGACSDDKKFLLTCDANNGLISSVCQNGASCAVANGKASCGNASSQQQQTTPVLDCSTNAGKMGLCQETTLYYCNADGSIGTEQCTHQKGCATASDGFAQCYADCGAVTADKCSDKADSIITCDKNIGLSEKVCDEGTSCKAKDGKIGCFEG